MAAAPLRVTGPTEPLASNTSVAGNAGARRAACCCLQLLGILRFLCLMLLALGQLVLVLLMARVIFTLMLVVMKITMVLQLFNSVVCCGTMGNIAPM